MKRINLLVIGQSNIANHGNGDKLIGWGNCIHKGKHEPLSNPVSGGSGDGTSVWPYVGDILRDLEEIESFSVTLCAQGGTSINDWVNNRSHRNFDFFDYLAEIALQHEKITHVFFHQGERDNYLKTSKKNYVSDFKKFKIIADAYIPSVPWIVCTASYRFGLISEPVREAQSEICATIDNCVNGPDTDTLDASFRRDDCHFNERGLNAFAAQIVSSLLRV